MALVHLHEQPGGRVTLHVPRGSITGAQRQAPRSRLTEASIGRDGSPLPRRRPARLVDAARQDGTAPAAAAEVDGRNRWERRGLPVAVADAMMREGRTD